MGIEVGVRLEGGRFFEMGFSGRRWRGRTRASDRGDMAIGNGRTIPYYFIVKTHALTQLPCLRAATRAIGHRTDQWP
jgi:hypothetical protein